LCFVSSAPKLAKEDFGRATVETTKGDKTYIHGISVANFNAKTVELLCKQMKYAVGVKYLSSSTTTSSSPVPRINYICSSTSAAIGECKLSAVLETTSDVAGVFCYSEKGK
jgi:hypothetical protein